MSIVRDETPLACVIASICVFPWSVYYLPHVVAGEWVCEDGVVVAADGDSAR